MKETAVFWQRPYGWRAGTRFVPPQASAVDVIRFEQEEYGNDLAIPAFLVQELAQKEVPARDIVWVCQTRDHARRYSGRGRGQPYKEDIGSKGLILATDNEPETGYLVLKDATVLRPSVVEQYVQYRRGEERTHNAGSLLLSEAPYPPVSWVHTQLRQNPSARLSRRRHILDVFLVGSEAKGTATPTSDLDIAVVVSHRRSRPTSLQLTQAYHAKFSDERQKPTWKGRVVDFQFFYETDEELTTYSKIPLA